jgi:hypothetical protein
MFLSCCMQKFNVNAEVTNMSTHKRQEDLYLSNLQFLSIHTEISEQDRISVSMGFDAILQPKILSLRCSNV